MRRFQAWFAALLVFTVAGAAAQSAAAQAAAAQRLAFNIPAQPVVDALNEFGRQTGLHVVLYSSLGAGVTSPQLQGSFTLEEALKKLLEKSGLSYEYLDKETVAIVAAHPITATDPSSLRVASAAAEGATTPGAAAASEQAGVGANGTRGESSPTGSESSARLAEIVITAQKRAERLQDVPIPVSVLNTEQLADTGQGLIRDYYASVPGLTARAGIYPGANTLLSIRGVNSGGGPPTVGILIDDVPFGSTYGGHAGIDVPDIDPGDLERIEVLRGPQGTLYGADSLGGLIKFVTKDASTNGYSGRFEAGSSSVYNGSEPGFNIRGSLNVPLGDTLAVRLSAFRRQDPGYIDNVFSGANGVNEAQADGARLSALWAPSAAFSLKLGAMYQRVRANGAPDSDAMPGLGYLQQSYPLGVGGYQTQDALFSAVLKAKLASVELTSVTGYNSFHTDHSLDYSSIWQQLVSESLGTTVSTPVYNMDGTRRISEELRASSSLGKSFDWLVGGYFSHELESDFQFANGIDPVSARIVGPLFFQDYFYGNVEFQEVAAFADLTYHFTDQFDVQVGARESHVSDSVPASALVFLGPPSLAAANSASNNVFTYLVTPRFQFAPDAMVYARFASGYRPAQPVSPTGIPGLPPQSSPDKTQNYEIGVKAAFFDNRLSVDASVYYIGFKDIQIVLRTPVVNGNGGIYYNANGGNAKSQGVEFSLTSRPWTGFTVSGWVSYDDAVLSQNFPASSTSYGLAGDRLPGTSEWSGNLSLEQRFSLWSGATGFVGGMTSFVGDRVGNFQGSALRQDYPAYTRTDLHAGVESGAWVTSVYVNNLTNRLGIIGGGIDAVPLNSFTYIQPRTIGLNVTRTF